MRRYDALARHERAQHADSQIKVFNLGIVSEYLAVKREPKGGSLFQSIKRFPGRPAAGRCARPAQGDSCRTEHPCPDGQGIRGGRRHRIDVKEVRGQRGFRRVHGICQGYAVLRQDIVS